jgi:hypothetical protein
VTVIVTGLAIGFGIGIGIFIGYSLAIDLSPAGVDNNGDARTRPLRRSGGRLVGGIISPMNMAYKAMFILREPMAF